MIVYKDMTFCVEPTCDNTACFRHRSHVPDEVKKPLLVAWGNLKSDTCGYFSLDSYIKGDNNECNK